MFEKNYHDAVSKDRKLGDEWAGWNGTDQEAFQDIEEGKGPFLLFSSGVMLLGFIVLGMLWYMIKPRLIQFGEPLLTGAWIVFVLAIALPMLVFALEIYSILFQRRTFLPYGLSEKFLIFFLPTAIWLGKRFGWSKDRVGNSFIKASNALTLSHDKKIRSDRPLVLLPRCLKKGVRKEILEIIDGRPCEIKTVGGGEEARRVIMQYRPNFIIALACERDLMSGIKDVAPRIPVLAIPNKRPEGPCKNTHINIDDFKEAFAYVSRGHISTNEQSPSVSNKPKDR